MESNQVVPECYADTLLARFLGFERANHQHGIPEVAKRMEFTMAKQKALGIVDNDKRVPPYFQGFELVATSDNADFKRHPSRPHFVIVIKPAIEGWLIAAADEAGFPSPWQRRRLQSICKSANLDQNQQFKDFLNRIVQCEPDSVTQLKSWIEQARRA